MRAFWLALTIPALVSAVATNAMANSVTPLPVEGFADMAIDDRHGNVFVTQFGSTVEVIDFAGNPVTSIGGQSRAAGMALNRAMSRLYVAQSTGDAIAEIDTRTLQERRRLPLGLGGACPLWSMSIVGPRLWFSFTCGGFCACQPPSGRGGIASVRVRRGLVQTYDGPSYQPIIAMDRRRRDVLLVAEAGLSFTPTYRYHVARTGVPTLEKFDIVPVSNVRDVTLLAKEDQFLVAAGAPYQVQGFRLDDFSFAASYATGPYPIAVAVTSDERFVAAGTDAYYDPDVYVYPVGSDAPINVYELGSGSRQDLAPGGLAFDRAAKHLFAVMGGFTGDTPYLHIIDAPLVPTSSTTTTTSTSTTTTTVPVPCGVAAFPQCGGECPAGESCTLSLVSGVGGCTCAPIPSCGFSTGTCGGNCPPGSACTQIHTQTCACQPTP